VRPNLVATGTMGFTAGHPLVEDIMAWLRTDSSHPLLRSDKAWRTVGPGCITRFLDSGKYADNMVIFPSHYFIPIHYCSEAQTYIGHQKVYAHQFWGTGECKYQLKNAGRDGDILLSSEIPPELLFPSPESTTSVSILVNSYNTPRKWIHECLQSIQNQKGVFAFELIWVDDGSETEFSDELTQELQWFERTTRFLVAVKYHKMATNVGTRRAIDHGISLCENELIIKMDADDLMISTRIKKQIEFMENNPQVVCCGGQLMQFNTNDETGQKVRSRITNHPLTITEDHCKYWEWFMNHPTLCYRKWAVLDIGGYGIGANLGEDRELEVRLLQHFGNGSLCNIDDILLLYRLHSGGISQNGII
jgi:UDP-Gal:alpha-D-GlcNAc-diphosphoundecaprenol beta-1,3-galactosyltransferase